MNNLLGLIALAVIYLCIVLRSDKKRRAGKEKKPAASGGRRARERKASFEAAFAGGERAQKPAAHSTSARASAKAAGPLAAASERPEEGFSQADCAAGAHAPGLHLHEVTQAQLRDAGEGEDPCHAGRSPRTAQAAQSAPGGMQPTMQDGTDAEAARELLRGVIMSEILERPCERRARQQARRRM